MFWVSFARLGLVLEASFQLPRTSLDFEAQGKVLSCPPSQLQTLGFVQVLFHHLPNSRNQRECSLCGPQRGSGQVEEGPDQPGALTSPKQSGASRRIRSFSRSSGQFQMCGLENADLAGEPLRGSPRIELLAWLALGFSLAGPCLYECLLILAVVLTFPTECFLIDRRGTEGCLALRAIHLYQMPLALQVELGFTVKATVKAVA